MRRLAILAVAAVLGLAVVAPAGAQGGATVPIEVRVWQDVEDELDIYISARGSGGSWDTLGTIPLPLDDGFSSALSFRFGDIRLEVPLPHEGVRTVAGRAGVHG